MKPPLLLSLVFACSAPLALAAPPRVELEVVVDQASANTAAPAWSQLLTDVGFAGVRIKSGSGESPALKTTGSAAAPAYRVVGVLTASNQLLLPGGRFGINDRSALEAWLTKLRDGGEDAVYIRPVAFGLLPKQLVAVHEALAAPVEFSTKERLPREVARQIAASLSYKFVTDPAGQQALAAAEPVADELEGLASGTSLAAVLRPLGLVMVPERSGAEVQLRIRDIAGAKEHWPVGWPPKGNPSETLPDLFKFLNVEIDKTPLSEVLVAISGRVKAPLLVDRNALARERADLETKVSFPSANTYYSRALDRLLSQARLKYDLRVDEANKPFLWITTLKP